MFRGRKKDRRQNYSWAELMKRVYEIDVLKCPDCSGRLKILAAIHRCKEGTPWSEILSDSELWNAERSDLLSLRFT
jgi:hypothetical protein